jgi:hypothetical protein
LSGIICRDGWFGLAGLSALSASLAAITNPITVSFDRNRGDRTCGYFGE